MTEEWPVTEPADGDILRAGIGDYITPVSVTANINCGDANWSGCGGTHTGSSEYAIDIGVGTGTNVRNIHTAICVFYDWSETGYGNHAMMLDTDNWWVAIYAHLDSFYEPNLDVWGDPLPQGRTIGWSGNTGYGTGAHLHYHVQVNSTSAPVYLGGMQGLSLNGYYLGCWYTTCPSPPPDFQCVCGQVN